ncbi:MAG TPA: hypothetical protein DD733_07465 [Clostridiales bacterium]|nr:hypothetical protein [Clostridiales bacterium]
MIKTLKSDRAILIMNTAENKSCFCLKCLVISENIPLYGIIQPIMGFVNRRANILQFVKSLYQFLKVVVIGLSMLYNMLKISIRHS